MRIEDLFDEVGKNLKVYIDETIKEGFRQHMRRLDESISDMQSQHYTMMGLSHRMDEITKAHDSLEWTLRSDKKELKASLECHDADIQGLAATSTSHINELVNRLQVQQLQIDALQAEVQALRSQLKKGDGDDDTQRPDQ